MSRFLHLVKFCFDEINLPHLLQCVNNRDMLRTMNKNKHFQQYVDSFDKTIEGDRFQRAANKIGLSRGSVRQIYYGQRLVTPDIAISVHKDTKGRISKAKLFPRYFS